jgi:sulfatase modifying factor 1
VRNDTIHEGHGEMITRALLSATFLLVSCNEEVVKQLKHSSIVIDAPAPKKSDGCDHGMVRVYGEHCKYAVQTCKVPIDPPGSIVQRCFQYEQTRQCNATQTPMDFCIEIEERTHAPDVLMPHTNVSWRTANSICKNDGRRLCTEEEWTLACEGPNMLPYPYGLVRDSSSDGCYHDVFDLVDEHGEMRDLRKSITTHPKCLSPFKVHNMVGNVDEWTYDTHASQPFRSALKGGWWGPLRNRCRATTVGHDESYNQVQIGFRCCSDVPGSWYVGPVPID